MISYSEHNLSSQFSAPQFNIARHRFRGARESEKVNLEIDQLTFSLRKIYEQQANFRANFRAKATILLDGGSINGLTDELATTVELVGLNDMTARAHMLQRRLWAQLQ
jgi:hypothetical protein